MSALVLAMEATAAGEVRRCEPFVELTDCVRCEKFGQHPILEVSGGFVSRVCYECGFEWKQIDV